MRIYFSETENHQKISKLANQLLQQNYLLLSANNLITNDLQSKYSQLYKLFDGRTMKFVDDEISKTEENYYDIMTTHDMDDDDFELDNRLTDANGIAQNDVDSNSTDVFVAPVGVPKVKRALDNSDERYTMPKRFASLAQTPHSATDNLNSTQVLAKHSNMEEDLDDDIRPIADTTFSLNTNLKSVLAAKRPLSATRALKESNPNINKVMNRGKRSNAVKRTYCEIRSPKFWICESRDDVDFPISSLGHWTFIVQELLLTTFFYFFSSIKTICDR